MDIALEKAENAINQFTSENNIDKNDILQLQIIPNTYRSENHYHTEITEIDVILIYMSNEK